MAEDSTNLQFHIADEQYFKDMLEYLLEHRNLGKYPENECQEARAFLASYFDAKNSNNEAFFNTVLLTQKLDEQKPEVFSIILCDMFMNANNTTEKFLSGRDKIIDGRVERIKSNQGRPPEILHETTIFQGGTNANLHSFWPADIERIKTYIFEPTYKKYGFLSVGYPSEITKIFNKYFDIVRRQGVGLIKAYIYAFVNLEQCMSMTDDKKSFNKQAIINNIRKNLNNREKLIIAQNPRSTLSRINFIDYVNSNPDKFGNERLLFKTESDYMKFIMENEEKLYCTDTVGMAPEIELAMSNFKYKPENERFFEPLSFRALRDYLVFHKAKDDEERKNTDKQIKRIFLNCCFGELNDFERNLLDRFYREAKEYYKDLSEHIEDVSNTFELLDLDLDKEEALDTTPKHHDGIPKDGKRKYHRKERGGFEVTPEEVQFIRDVAQDGIRWTGKVLGAEVGSKSETRDRLYYFVFAMDGYYILEPLSQEGNATFFIEADKPIEELRKELSDKHFTLDTLAENNRAIRLYHVGYNSQNNPNRLKLMAEFLRETSKSVKAARQKAREEALDMDGITLEELSAIVTSKLKVSSIPTASSYIKKIQGFGRGPEANKKVKDFLRDAGVSLSQLSSIRDHLIDNAKNGEDK